MACSIVSRIRGVDVEICKVDNNSWVRISHFTKNDILQNQFSEQFKDNVLKTMVDSSIPSSPEPSSYNLLNKRPSITHSDVLFTTADLTKSMISPPQDTNGNPATNPILMYVDKASLNPVQYDFKSRVASLWDFAGQAIFHNTHSVFIPNNGVTVITFDASMELTDNTIPREGFPQLPECCSIISSIHYWLKVVNSVCSAKENVLLVGTHIDKLHLDIKEARKIASENILPVLEKELCPMLSTLLILMKVLKELFGNLAFSLVI